MTLKQMLDEFGISTYEKLSERCKRMGVVVPERIEFDTVMPPSSYVNNPTQGLIVLDAIPIDQVDVDVAKKHKRKKLTLNDDVVESLIESE